MKQKKKQINLNNILINKKTLKIYIKGNDNLILEIKNKITKIKLNKILTKKPITKMNIKVIHNKKSNIKSNKMKSISNHHKIKSKLLTHNKSKTRLSFFPHL